MLSAISSQALLAGVLICLVALLGGVAYFLPEASLRRVIPLGASLSVGVLLGDAFLHLLPEAVERLGNVQLVMQWTLGSMLIFFVLEKAVRWSHAHSQLDVLTLAVKPMAPMNLMGDGIHNFIDGTLIGGAFLVSPEAGWATTLGIVVHELPQEIGDIGTLVWGGYSVRRAIWYNLLCATTSLLGVGAILWTGLWLEGYTAYALPLAAGGFIYIAGTDLIPELHRQTARQAPLWQSLFIALGVGIMICLKFLE
ncbi:ZIP family metal transporter [Spirosoma aerolatum]|uniref:ZIP family metal transporter n=1 Tax=Spirosoma aerolatum TaxID=1211326 RepID=UPI0009AD066B|nr:ZIP family metal transporter [Spirosoma aerolatum]